MSLRTRQHQEEGEGGEEYASYKHGAERRGTSTTVQANSQEHIIMRQRDGDHFLPTGKALKQATTLQGVLLVVSVVSVFAVISIWAPVGILLVALLIIAFAGGAMLGKMGAIL